MWTACVLTIFPDMFPGPLGQSLAGQALAGGRWGLDTLDIRDFATDKHRSVDDTPAGGGPGMVMRADVLGAAIDGARERHPGLPLLYPSPRGRPLTQARIRELSAGPGVIAALRALRGDRPARDRCARGGRGLHRRLYSLRRRAGGDGHHRCGGAAAARRDGGAGVRLRRKASRTACSNIPTIRARANGRAGRSPTSCCRAITSGLRHGGGRSRRH